MVDEQRVRRKARMIARDARKTRDLSDDESECLRDLLASDEAFAFLVDAQQSAVMFDSGHGFDVDDETAELAIGAADRLGDAIDRVLDERLEDARAIERLRQGVDAVEGLNAYHLYEAGFETAEDLREASFQALTEAKSISPSRAAKIKADVATPEGGVAPA